MGEREFTPDQAQAQFSKILDNLHCFCEIESYGSTPIITHRCSIFCKKSKKLLGKGNGKGLGLQSKLSAQFEALEHMLCHSGKFIKKYEEFSLEEIEQQKIPILSSVLYSEFKDKDFDQRNVPLPWAPYTLFGTQEIAYLPLIQTHPFYIFEPIEGDYFDYSRLYHKTTSNGLASGCTFREAMIHALLEIVERHSTSIFLVETFLKKNPSKVRILDHSTLPEHLLQLVKEVEETVKDCVLIVEMGNRFDIPVYGCLTKHKEGILRGFGASLDRSYAIERALLEMMQQYHLNQWKKSDKLEKIICHNPHLEPCVHWNVPWALQKHGHVLVAYEETHVHKDLGNYLEKILDNLNKEKFSVYYNEVYAHEHIHALHVIVPEAEMFCMIELGVLTPLKSHGKAILEGC